MKKYELTGETKVVFGRTLYRIKATIAFGDINEGDLGGFVEKEENLSHDDNAWVYGNAKVYGDAWVYGNARVSGDAEVYGDARVYRASHLLVVGPCGSRNAFTTFFRNKDKEISVKCGCFLGNIDEFLAKVSETHGDNKHALVYRAAVELAKVHIDLEEDGNKQQ